MNNNFDASDLDGMPDLTVEAVEQALARGDSSAADLLMLYLACVVGDPDEPEEFGGAADRIADALFEMAEAGDEDAMLAMGALNALTEEDGSEEAQVVGAAMFRAVATRPILLNVANGQMDFDAAAAALVVIDTLAGGFSDADLDLDDLEDLDIDALAEILGVDAADLDWDGDPDDR